MRSLFRNGFIRQFSTLSSDKIRNIAIIAHVDHGKTTLVDRLLQQSGSLKDESVQRVMDSNDLEKERGITILAKNTSIKWKGYKINVVDTPGHADFGGEVERILSMVDSVLLLVDAVDGPMPQTRFVTQKAFKQGINPILVVNKIDRVGARPDWVINQVFDLFDNLGATDAQLDFPIVYASALQGFAKMDLNSTKEKDMSTLFDLIISKVNPPKVNSESGKGFQLQTVFLDYSNYFGIIGVGKVNRGEIKMNDSCSIVARDGTVRYGKISKLFGHEGLERLPIETGVTGDIVAIAGIENLTISETVCSKDFPEALPNLVVDEPTVSMIFQANNSPFFGREGTFVTSRQLRDRLYKEAAVNIALKVEDTDDLNKIKVSGRGELQLSIFLETIRREGFEILVSKPQAIIRIDADGRKEEPYEELVIEVNESAQGQILQILGERQGVLGNMTLDGKGRVRLEYVIPSRGLIGFHGDFLSITSGTGVLTHTFSHYGPMNPSSLGGERKNGAIVSQNPGKSTIFAIFHLQPRGRMFISPQTEVYEGMIVGVRNRESDMMVNIAKEKHLSNVRSTEAEEKLILSPPINLTLEYALDFINNDELVEVTPKCVRLRKKFLKESDRKRTSKNT